MFMFFFNLNFHMTLTLYSKSASRHHHRTLQSVRVPVFFEKNRVTSFNHAFIMFIYSYEIYVLLHSFNPINSLTAIGFFIFLDKLIIYSRFEFVFAPVTRFVYKIITCDARINKVKEKS